MHEPRFLGNERKYVLDCIDSSFVSSVGEYVDKFEQALAKKVNSRYAIACLNGTSALHIALLLANVEENDLVITQSLTFVATCNAIKYTGARPIFIDVDKDTLSLSPQALENFLQQNCIIKNDQCIHKDTSKIIKACVPMHTFGHPCKIDQITNICKQWYITLVEDAAESLGSYYKQKHTGTFGLMGIFSFNGNKIITAGSGGVIITNDDNLAKRAKHLTTTAKEPHLYEYVHNEIGYNYRMSNINAALLLAQLEQLDLFLASKRKLYMLYKAFFDQYDDIMLFAEPQDANSNYWLQTIIMQNKTRRDNFLQYTNGHAVMTRPIWQPINTLPMFANCIRSNLDNTDDLAYKVINIPSSTLINNQ